VSEPVGEPAGAVEGVEPAGAGVSPADGGPEPAVGRDGGDGDTGVGPEGGPAVAQAPDAGAVEGDGVPAAEPVVGEGAQPAALTTQEDAPAPELTERQAYVAKVEAAVEDLEVGDTIVNGIGDEFEVAEVIRTKNGKFLGIVVPKETGEGFYSIDSDGVGALLFPSPYIDTRTGERKLSEPGRIVKKEDKAKPATEAPTPPVEAETPTAPAVEAEVTTPAVEAETEAEAKAETKVEAPTTPKTAPLSAGAAADITSKLDAVKSKSARSQTPEEKAVLAYLNGYNGDPDAALEALGFDLAVREGITQRRKGDDSDVDLAYKVYKELGQGRFDRLPAGTGGTVTGRGAATKQAPADLALKWLRENGDPDTNAKVDAAIDAALGAVEKQIRYRTAPGGRRRKTVPVLPRLQAAARTGRSRASIISELVTELDSPTMNPKRVEKLAKLLPKEGALALINRALEGNRVQGKNVGLVTNILEKQQRRPRLHVAADLAAVQIEEAVNYPAGRFGVAERHA